MTSASSSRLPRGRRLSPADVAGPGVLAIGRGALIAAGFAFTCLAAWGVGSAWYLLFRDEIAARFIARQTEMQYAYEEKIGALRARLDRVASQKLLEQDSLETRVADMVARQVRLENRQAVLTTLAGHVGGPAATGSLKAQPLTSQAPASDGLQGLSAYAPIAPKPMPAPEPFGLRLREGESGAAPGSLPKQRQSLREGAKLSPTERLSGVEASLARIEGSQLQALEGSLQTTQGQVFRLRTAMADVGLDPDALPVASPKGGMGGPLVPLAVDPKAGPFEALVDRVQASVAQLDRLRRFILTVPLNRPVPGDPDLTSGFGYRLDPFTRSPALHTGLDFRAEYGMPVRATAEGRVLSADYSGGYGNLVEVDHGNGVTTRYAHLSSIAVAPGQTVAAGAVLGQVGSTGRSTRPHLHYETRLEGEPVDPQRFLRAGARLVAVK